MKKSRITILEDKDFKYCNDLLRRENLFLKMENIAENDCLYCATALFEDSISFLLKIKTSKDTNKNKVFVETTLEQNGKKLQTQKYYGGINKSYSLKHEDIEYVVDIMLSSEIPF